MHERTAAPPFRGAMIYTITLNPALDRILTVESIEYDNPNRVNGDERYAGGKGIDVSKALTRLGVENKALGFAGGFTGLELEGCLLNLGVNCEFIRISAETRTNVFINEVARNRQISFNLRGPFVQSFELMQMIDKINGLKDAQYVILSGSVPAGVNPIIYRKIIEIAKTKGATVVLDSDNEPFRAGLRAKPRIIKPNVHELERLMERELNDLSAITSAAQAIHETGIEIVLVSMGPKGMLLVTEGERWVAVPPEVTVINTIGAGDSAVAGFVHGLTLGESYSNALKRSAATGTAATLIKDVSITNERVQALLDQVKLHEVR
ncbi:MAG: 1-phosphofructokinase [Halobacteriota archaeon]